MFRLVPLGSVLRTSAVKVDNIPFDEIPKITGMYREVHGPNVVSSVGGEYCISNEKNGEKNPWYMDASQSNHLLVMKGSRKLELYCNYQKRKRYSL